MGDLFTYFDNNTGRLINKWQHYFGIYERHLGPFRGKPILLVEYGVFHGGSLEMWRDYLGPEARIVGVDIDPRCRDLGGDNIDIVIGDQSDPATHRKLIERYGQFDVVIDDGGHSMTQQIVTFQEMYPAVKPGGIFLAEDLHTSYFPDWGGGYRRPGTFIEYSKKLIDQLYGWYTQTPEHRIDHVTRSAYGLHFYDSVLVIEKAEIGKPVQLVSGTPSFPVGVPEYTLLARQELMRGRPARAIDRCREGLALEPGNAELAAILREAEAAR